MPKSHVSKRKQEFQKNYHQLQLHVDDNGRLILDQSNREEKRLSNWLGRQKQRKKMSVEEQQMLSRILGDSWLEHRDVKNDKSWSNHFDEMVKYRREYNTWVISKKDSAHQKLYDWAAKQRKLWRDGSLLPERENKLIAAGFDFERSGKPQKERKFTEQQQKNWNKRYDELLAYKERHGHCNVKCNDEEHRELAKWVILQRMAHRRSKLDTNRRQRLEDAHFVFEPKKSERDCKFVDERQSKWRQVKGRQGAF